MQNGPQPHRPNGPDKTSDGRCLTSAGAPRDRAAAALAGLARELERTRETLDVLVAQLRTCPRSDPGQPDSAPPTGLAGLPDQLAQHVRALGPAGDGASRPS